MVTVFLCRTSWLRHYDGRSDDPPIANHGWVRQGKVPHEIKNFLPTRDGRMLGFVQVKGSARININRLGASSKADRVTGITVVWCAQDPSGRGVVVTGWYQDTTVFRDPQDSLDGRTIGGTPVHHRMEAGAANCHLLDSSARDHVVQPRGTPRSAAIFGMADLCYVSERYPERAKSILAYLREQNVERNSADRAASAFGGGADAENNRRVEEAAIRVVIAHYAGWSFVDKSSENLGWDLEFRKGKKRLFVEVKGRSPKSPAPVVLTSNERRQFELSTRDQGFADAYRLAIVHAALGNRPSLHLYGHTTPTGWVCEVTGERLIMQPLGLLVHPISGN